MSHHDHRERRFRGDKAGTTAYRTAIFITRKKSFSGVSNKEKTRDY